MIEEWHSREIRDFCDIFLYIQKHQQSESSTGILYEMKKGKKCQKIHLYYQQDSSEQKIYCLLIFTKPEHKLHQLLKAFFIDSHACARSTLSIVGDFCCWWCKKWDDGDCLLFVFSMSSRSYLSSIEHRKKDRNQPENTVRLEDRLKTQDKYMFSPFLLYA